MAEDNDIKIAELSIESRYIKERLDIEVDERKKADIALVEAQKEFTTGLKQVSNRVLVLTTGLGLLWTAVNFLPKFLTLIGA